MRNVLTQGARVVAVMGFATALLASATSRGPLPPMRAKEAVTVYKSIDGVTVVLTPRSYAAWAVTVSNDRDEQIALLWDESSFVRSDNVSRGRLIRGDTRLINTDRTQPGSPVAPHARLV